MSIYVLVYAGVMVWKLKGGFDFVFLPPNIYVFFEKTKPRMNYLLISMVQNEIFMVKNGKLVVALIQVWKFVLTLNVNEQSLGSSRIRQIPIGSINVSYSLIRRHIIPFYWYRGYIQS